MSKDYRKENHNPEIEKKLQEVFLSTKEVLSAAEFSKANFDVCLPSENLCLKQDDDIEEAISWYKDILNTCESVLKAVSELKEMEKVLKNNAALISSQIETELGGDEWHGINSAITYRQSESVEIFDEEDIPTEYMKIPKPSVDKTAVKKALLAGIMVPGAMIVSKKNIQIK